MILVSTGGVKQTPIDETVRTFYAAGIRSIELSGGPYFEEGLDGLKKVIQSLPGLKVSVHNYFPPPKEPFVLNLGSLNEENYLKSCRHAKTAIDWASTLGSPWYSFHAGFLIDPPVSQLGKKIEKIELFDRAQCLRRFVSAVKELSLYAREKNVQLFVENNVLSQKNFQEFGNNPLLCVTPDETAECMQVLQGSAKLLVDVAHLKVSAHTLGFEPRYFFEKCDSFIDAYHLSDNDGTADTNDSFNDQAWFVPYLKKQVSFKTVEVYRAAPSDLAKMVAFRF